MQTIEYRTIDKADWPRGEWDAEPDKRQWLDEATGLPCLIVRAGPAMGHLCGYVGVPKGHPCHGKDYNAVDVDVHGGLTFAAGCSHGPEDKGVCHKPDPGEPDDVWWLGFDCAHLYDKSPGMSRLKFHELEAEYRDIAYVTREVERLARQLSELGHFV